MAPWANAGWLADQGGWYKTISLGGVLNPLTLPSLNMWVKDSGTFQNTAGTTPATATSDPVQFWTDNSGNGNHLISGVTTVATLTTSAQNSRSTVNFNGNVNTPLRASITISSLSKYSVFGVFMCSHAGTRNFDRFVSALGSGQFTDYNSLNGFQIATDNTSTLPIPIAAGANSLNATATMVINTYHQLGLVFDGANFTFYVDGVSVGGNAAAMAMVSPLLLQLGDDQAGDAMTGGCGEFLAGNADWTSNASSIKAYFLSRWGV
jgi:hypothetical protein